MTAPDLLRLGIIDGIIPEPEGGAHENFDEAAQNLRLTLLDGLDRLAGLSAEQLVEDRYEKFRKMGNFFA